MKLHSLTITDMRGVTSCDLRDLPDTGVVMIHGNNESGKSTLVEALDLLLREKFSTSKKAIQDIKPVDRDVATVISGDLTIGDYRMIITKTFNKNKAMTLRFLSGDVGTLTGEEAHTRLTQLCERYIDTSLFDALFIRQGEVADSIEPSGISCFQRVLGGVNTQGDTGSDEQGIVDAARAKYLEFYTKTGKLNATKTIDEDIERVKVEQRALRDRVTKLASTSELIARIRRDEGELKDRRARVADDLVDARNACERARQCAERLKQVSHEEAIVKLTREKATDEVDAARSLVDKVTAVAEDIAVLTTKFPAARAAVESIARKRADINKQQQQCREDIAAAASDERAAIAAEKAATAARDISRYRRDLNVISSRLDTIDQLDRKAAELEAQRETITITSSIVDELAAAASRVDVATAALGATAPTLSLHGPENTTIDINGDTQPIPALPVEVSATTTLRIGDVTAVITPGQGVERSVQEKQAAEQALRDLCADYGVDHLADAQQQLAHRQKLADEYAVAVRERAIVVGASSVEDLRAEARRLAADIEQAGAVTGQHEDSHDHKTGLAHSAHGGDNETSSNDTSSDDTSSNDTQSVDVTDEMHEQRLHEAVEKARTDRDDALARKTSAEEQLAELNGTFDGLASAPAVQDYINLCEELNHAYRRRDDLRDDVTQALTRADITCTHTSATVDNSLTDPQPASTSAPAGHNTTVDTCDEEQQSSDIDKHVAILVGHVTVAAPVAQGTEHHLCRSCCETMLQHYQQAAQEADTEATTIAVALKQAHDEAKQNDLGVALAEVERLEKIRANITREQTEAKTKLAEATSIITNDGGSAEHLAQVSAELEVLSAQRDRLIARAAAAKRLYDTLKANLDRVRSAYVEPYEKQLAAYAQLVFGAGSVLKVDPETLSVVSRVDSSGAAVAVSSLSGGATEQVALIARLAVASMVATDRSVGPIVIDDALGASDAWRTGAMSRLIASLGRSCQVIVFTCDRRRFDELAYDKKYDLDQERSA